LSPIEKSKAASSTLSTSGLAPFGKNELIPEIIVSQMGNARSARLSPAVVFCYA